MYSLKIDKLLLLGNIVVILITAISCKKNGYREEYYENGNLKYSGYFIDGLTNGELKKFDSTGSLVGVYNSKAGKLYGNYTIIGKGGLVEERGNYINDTLDGVVNKYLGRLTLNLIYEMGEIVENTAMDNEFNCIVQKSKYGKIYNYDSENNCILVSIAMWQDGKKVGEIYLKRNGIVKAEGRINYLSKDDSIILNKDYPNWQEQIKALEAKIKDID